MPDVIILHHIIILHVKKKDYILKKIYYKEVNKVIKM